MRQVAAQSLSAPASCAPHPAAIDRLDARGASQLPGSRAANATALTRWHHQGAESPGTPWHKDNQGKGARHIPSYRQSTPATRQQLSGQLHWASNHPASSTPPARWTQPLTSAAEAGMSWMQTLLAEGGPMLLDRVLSKASLWRFREVQVQSQALPLPTMPRHQRLAALPGRAVPQVSPSWPVTCTPPRGSNTVQQLLLWTEVTHTVPWG